MTVAVDARTNSTVAAGNPSFVHTPVGTPRAAIVFIGQDDASAADEVTGVNYGTEAMTRIATVNHTNDENIRVYCYFLGSGIPAGAQTVAVTGAGTTAKWMHVITLTAALDTEIVDFGTIDTPGPVANITPITLLLDGRVCYCALIWGSGEATITDNVPYANWTNRNVGEHDWGGTGTGMFDYDIIDDIDVSAGFDFSDDDASLIAVAVSEIAVAAASNKMLLLGAG